MTYRTRPAISADASPEQNRVGHFVIWVIQSLYLSMFLFTLQHHCVVTMGHKMNAWQLPDLFQLCWPLIPLCSVCKVSWSCPISQDDFESYFHPLTGLQPHPSQHETILSFSLLYILPETDHKAATKPCAYVPCNPTISVYALFILKPSIKKEKDTQLFVWFFFNKPYFLL